MVTVKQLIENLKELVKNHPECEDYQVIYSHDDEGNEYQRVINDPCLVQLHDKNQKSYRNLEIVGFYNADDSDDEINDEDSLSVNIKDCNALLIN